MQHNDQAAQQPFKPDKFSFLWVKLPENFSQ